MTPDIYIACALVSKANLIMNRVVPNVTNLCKHCNNRNES